MIKPVNDLPYIANLAKANINRVVKVTYTREFRPDDEYTVIASIKQVDEKFGYIEFGHPMDIESGQMTSGSIGVYYQYNDGKSDKIDIKFIYDPLIFEQWIENYVDFHNSVIKEKGYDFCEEDINALTI